MSEILIEESNPYGSLEAVVEDDGRTVYLYLCGEDADAGMRAVWVANRVAAPDREDFDAARQGRAPLMPRAGTRHPAGHPGLDPTALSLVWSEAGDRISLLERDRLLAVIPSWAEDGTPGYAAEAIGQTPLAWELALAVPELAPGVEAARAFWEWRDSDASWEYVQGTRMAHLEARLGPHQRYYAADGGSFPPRAVAVFAPAPGAVVYATVGMSGQPMPGVEASLQDPAQYRRVELALVAREEDPERARLLSAMMAMPWRRLTWLGPGHTYAWNGGAALLLDGPPASEPAVPDLTGLTDWNGDPVTWRWAVRISPEEQRDAVERGSESLAQRIAADMRRWYW